MTHLCFFYSGSKPPKCHNIHARIKYRTKKCSCSPLVYFSQLQLQAVQLFHAEVTPTHLNSGTDWYHLHPTANTTRPGTQSKIHALTLHKNINNKSLYLLLKPKNKTSIKIRFKTFPQIIFGLEPWF